MENNNCSKPVLKTGRGGLGRRAAAVAAVALASVPAVPGFAFAATFSVDTLNSLLTFLWSLLIFAGGIIAAIGIYRWVSGGKSHDAQAQEGAVWVIALGGAMVAIGVAMNAFGVTFPTLSL